MSMSPKNIKDGFLAIQTALDRISQALDPDFEPDQGIEGLVKDIDEAIVDLENAIAGE